MPRYLSECIIFTLCWTLCESFQSTTIYPLTFENFLMLFLFQYLAFIFSTFFLEITSGKLWINFLIFFLNFVVYPAYNSYNKVWDRYSCMFKWLNMYKLPCTVCGTSSCSITLVIITHIVITHIIPILNENLETHRSYISYIRSQN